ncbi:MAG TPA: hypothetical protein PKO06_06270, partial [Candidatus Ozemobacteraceae bacterium]|nr:hypothetical protein [Candidatus Ozemobacteraceae bacterium]
MPAAWARRLILLLPLLTLVLLVEAGARRERISALTRFTERGQDMLERLAARIDAERGVLEPLLQIGHLTASPQTRAGQPNLGLANLLSKFSGTLDLSVYFFTPEGGWQGCQPEQAENQWLFKKVMAGLGQGGALDETRRKEIDRLLRSVFGFGHSLNSLLLSQGRPQLVQYRNQPAWIFWERGSAGGVLVICRRWPSDLERLRGLLTSSSGNWIAGILVGFRPAGASDWSVFGAGSAGQVEDIWQQIRARGGLESDWENRRCFSRTTRGGGTLLAAFPVPDSLRSRPISAGAAWSLLLGVPLILFFGFGRDRLGMLRRALIVLFLLTALVPTAGLVTETLWSIDIRREVLEAEVSRAQGEALRALDQGFHDYRLRLERRLSGLLQNNTFYHRDRVQVPESLKKLLEDLGGNYDLRNPMGKILEGSGGPWGLGAVANSLLQMVMETWIPERLPAVRPKIDPVLDGALREQRTGFWNIAQRPQRLLELTTGKRVQFLFWHYFADPRHPAVIFLSILPGENLVRHYLHQAVAERYDC